MIQAEVEEEEEKAQGDSAVLTFNKETEVFLPVAI